MAIQDYSVLVLHNTPRTAGGDAATSSQAGIESDAGVLDEVKAVAEALTRLGVTHRIASVPLLKELPGVLAVAPEPVVFNLVEGFQQRPEEANFVPALCLSFGKACTGNDTQALCLALDKWQTKVMLKGAAIPSSDGVIVPVGGTIPFASLPTGKVIIKPVATDASEGIESSSVLGRLETQRIEAIVRQLHTVFKQPVIIEKYIGNRELNVSVLQRGDQIEVLPLAEIDFSAFAAKKPRIVDYAAKWLPETFEFQNTPRLIPAPLDDALAETVRQMARRAWLAVGCSDYARVDLRLTDSGKPYVLEINTNPDISPTGGFAAALSAAGLTFPDFIAGVLENAVHRLTRLHHGSAGARGPLVLGATAMPAAAEPRPSAPPCRIRRTEAADRAPIVTFVQATGFFRDDEIPVAAEVLDDAIADGPSGDYQSFTAIDDKGTPIGWICYGKTACCVGTYDIYWIAVDKNIQAKGVGRALMRFAEDRAREEGGRLAVIETAGKARYDATRAFYLRIGYFEAARLPEFYAPGDDKIVYLKRL